MDVTTLKRFRQNACNDPVAIQILGLAKPKDGSSSVTQNLRKPRFPPKTSPVAKESFAGEVHPRQGKIQGQPRNAGEMSKLDSPSSLPQKDGKVDMTQYAKYKKGGLRQKVHQAIRDKHCIRCWSPQHLRSSCPEPPKKWEEDFNRGKAAFWGPKPKQSRPQWVVPLEHLEPLSNPSPKLLFAVDSDHLLALDTASEVSIGRIDILQNVRLVQNPVLVEGIGGMHSFEWEGELLLAGGSQLTVFAGTKADLPPEFHALLGTRHLRELGVSLDYVMDNPGGTLQQAIRHRSTRTLPLVSLLSPTVKEATRGVCLEHFALFSLVFLVAFLLALTFNEASNTHLPWIEPRAFFVSLVALVFAKLVCEKWRFWLSPWSQVHDPSLAANQSVRFSPALSSRQQERVRQSHASFARLFADFCPAPTITRRVPTLAPFRNPAVTNRALTSKQCSSGFRRKIFSDLPRPPLDEIA
jgi:hypothetical protein